eukprot:TRINITY_DN4648_c0_g1_i1.p1 TRINITY_DN4648_c0_g1~~TRINITY_DN4648_c0_g1_i1.p1  ORF type:complete len:1036 (+),score=251.02 TRINITY_DN4648_c0_g1_i1:181-3108(+)
MSEILEKKTEKMKRKKEDLRKKEEFSEARKATFNAFRARFEQISNTEEGTAAPTKTNNKPEISKATSYRNYKSTSSSNLLESSLSYRGDKLSNRSSPSFPKLIDLSQSAPNKDISLTSSADVVLQKPVGHVPGKTGNDLTKTSDETILPPTTQEPSPNLTKETKGLVEEPLSTNQEAQLPSSIEPTPFKDETPPPPQKVESPRTTPSEAPVESPIVDKQVTSPSETIQTPVEQVTSPVETIVEQVSPPTENDKTLSVVEPSPAPIAEVGLPSPKEAQQSQVEQSPSIEKVESPRTTPSTEPIQSPIIEKQVSSPTETIEPLIEPAPLPPTEPPQSPTEKEEYSPTAEPESSQPPAQSVDSPIVESLPTPPESTDRSIETPKSPVVESLPPTEEINHPPPIEALQITSKEISPVLVAEDYSNSLQNPETPDKPLEAQVPLPETTEPKIVPSLLKQVESPKANGIEEPLSPKPPNNNEPRNNTPLEAQASKETSLSHRSQPKDDHLASSSEISKNLKSPKSKKEHKHSKHKPKSPEPKPEPTGISNIFRATGSEKGHTFSSPNLPSIKEKPRHADPFLSGIVRTIEAPKKPTFWFWEREQKLIDEPHGPIPISSYMDLPVEVRVRCQEELGLDKSVMEENLLQIFQITHTRMRKFFPSYKGVQVRRKWVPFITAEVQEYAEKLLEPDKKAKKQFKKMKLLTEGSHSKIYVAEMKKPKKPVYIKILSNENQREKELNLAEISFLCLCKHPNIISFEKAILTTQKSKKSEPIYETWVVTEYVRGGDCEVLAKSRLLEESHVAYIAREALKGLAYLHERHFVHRDINPSNILVSVAGEVKITDFGQAADVHDGPRYQMIGQPFYVSPEMIHRRGHDCVCDVWSLGAVLLELFLGEPPIQKSTVLCLFTTATKGLLHLLPVRYSMNCQNFMGKCLETKDAQRVSSTELLKHPWVTQPNLTIPSSLLTSAFYENATVKQLLY